MPASTAYMIPGGALSAPSAYRDIVTAWLSSISDVGYQFATMDINGDGVLTLAELQAVIAPFGPQWALLPEALMAMGDRDGNGCISLAEFHQLGQLLQWNAQMRGALGGVGMVAGPPAPFAGTARYNHGVMREQVLQGQRDLVMRWLTTFPNIDQEFFVLDANHDGYLTEAEIAMACATAGPQVSVTALRRTAAPGKSCSRATDVPMLMLSLTVAVGWPPKGSDRHGGPHRRRCNQSG